MNIDSFTDEQLLNLVNNSILQKTNFDIGDLTGGYVSITLNAAKKQDTCKIALLFGYKNRNSQNVIFEIDNNLIFIWLKAIKLKTESLKVDNTGMNFNELNGLINKSYAARTKTHCTPTPLPNTIIPPTLVPLQNNSFKEAIDNANIKTFLEMKDFLLLNRKDKNGGQIQFKFENRLVSISDSKLPYYRDTQKNLDFKESDRFYKTILREFKQ